MELAGLLAEGDKKTDVILVHGPSSLLGPLVPAGIRSGALRALERLGVDVRLSTYCTAPPPAADCNDRWMIPAEGRVTLEAAAKEPGAQRTSLPALEGVDVIVYSSGGAPATAMFDASVLSSRGFVKVDSTLRVLGAHNVFAAGDIADTDQPKQIFTTRSHVAHLKKALQQLLEAMDKRKLLVAQMASDAVETDGCARRAGAGAAAAASQGGDTVALSAPHVRSLADVVLPRYGGCGSVLMVPIGNGGVGHIMGLSVPSFVVRMFKVKTHFSQTSSTC